MRDHILIVHSNPVEGREDEYNEWYDKVHLSDVLKVPGFVAARRYRAAGTPADGNAPAHRYIAIYELRTDDPDATLQALFEAFEAGMDMSETIDLQGSLGSVYEAVTDRMTE